VRWRRERVKRGEVEEREGEERWRRERVKRGEVEEREGEER